MDASVSTPLARGRGAIAPKISEGRRGASLRDFACTKRASDAPVAGSANRRREMPMIREGTGASGDGLGRWWKPWTALPAAGGKGEDVFSRMRLARGSTCSSRGGRLLGLARVQVPPLVSPRQRQPIVL